MGQHAPLRGAWNAVSSAPIPPAKGPALCGDQPQAVALPIAFKQTMISVAQKVTRRPIPSDHRR
jgi:hypothetical protein